jgi:TetR/AcrR family transcriptional regulator, tetracycline repressor protein
MRADVKIHRGLTTERVVDAALRLADEEGLERLSLRRLAAALDVTPMSIYRHVRDKDDLLDLMVDRLLEQLDLAASGSQTWQEALRRLAAALLAMLEAHPAAPLLLSRPFNSQSALRISETMLAILDRAGFSPDQSVRLLQVMTGMVLGPAIHRATYAAAWREPPKAAGGEASSAGLSPDQFPYVARLADQLAAWSSGPEADRLAVELLVAGLAALAAQNV